ncbi:cell filamentation protein Fic [Clavibacter michiganensis subsp. insidiosus]|uniref:protein adenylyltransferase n=2 Tax=Clavibacter michiganensis subsp. insidiosus TaxID=33014 RepID=A0A0D5CK62_9MICO|nr:Fic family protein [Clavibacter michiganensis]AJW80043.1 cell filamentation protein Fic [Clavibacter michiganensis subsp. insidiosus]AWG02599.1 cell filamentation protein Fic [Clavibacter michiganensis subsp. insidiosus]OQJ58967.1 cell filamentation protein Fic [Clavibacter michiganensis subsp. insidiosus]RII88135.1 cell filamentation protein Fic [Clavibacter michiganensis subsp. insidiosus]RMC85292.1 cell filamentation protein Fic [Clavibacter michiganensis subsp. insidiosus]
MPRRSTFRTWEDYYIPGSKVLRNKFTAPGKPHGETDATKLGAMEEATARMRAAELNRRPVVGAFDYPHMKAIHRHLFQDVYDWAGEERVAPIGSFMTKDGHSYYPAGPTLTEAAEAQYRQLADKDLLRGLEQPDFVRELAESWGELNVIHSFREGNTRTQFVFFSQLAEQAGYRIDWSRFAVGSPLREQFVEARFHSQDTGSNARLEEVLGRAIVPLPRPASPGTARPAGPSASRAVRGAARPGPLAGGRASGRDGGYGR